MNQLGLDLEFMHAGLHKLQKAAEAEIGDADGFVQRDEFVCGLDHTQLVRINGARRS